MLKRILCPIHEESTPSCVIYEDGYKCFGCGASGPLSEVGESGTVRELPKFVERVSETLERIAQLPVSTIRGLPLRSDGSGYYIVWPQANYYKLRKWEADDGSKYRCPSGVPKPLWFDSGISKRDYCIVVEGELNALSAREVLSDYDTICPGGTGDFYSERFKKTLPSFKAYKKLYVFLDKDAAGVLAAIKFKALVTPFVQDVQIILLTEDFNETLQKEGPEGLRTKIQSYMGMR